MHKNLYWFTMRFLRWYSLADLTKKKRHWRKRESTCNPREISPAIIEIFLENPRGQSRCFSKRDRFKSKQFWQVCRIAMVGGRGCRLVCSRVFLRISFFFSFFSFYFSSSFPLSPITPAPPCSVSRSCIYLSVWLIGRGDSSEVSEMVDLAAESK